MKKEDFSDIDIYCDGGARGNPGAAASAFVVLDRGGKQIAKGAKAIGRTTNNVAEYMAVYLALKWLSKKKVSRVNFFLDSELIVKQLAGEYRVKNKTLQKFFVHIKNFVESFPGKISFTHVTRNKNKLPDKLVNQVLDSLTE